MDVQLLSTQYTVRRLTQNDADAVLALAAQNTLFYQYHPPLPTRERILADMDALPPGKAMADKYFVGFYRQNTLTAVMDLVRDYPTAGTAYIGWFITDAAGQGKGRGTALLRECEAALKNLGCRKIRLAIDCGNPQSTAFWTKNGYRPVGKTVPADHGAYQPMQKQL